MDETVVKKEILHIKNNQFQDLQIIITELAEGPASGEILWGEDREPEFTQTHPMFFEPTIEEAKERCLEWLKENLGDDYEVERTEDVTKAG